MSSLPPLPFEIDEQSIDNWLITLSRLDSTLACNELYRVIKVLYKQSGDSGTLFLIIDQITPAVLHFSQRLEVLFTQQTASLNAKNRKIARLNSSLLRYLSLAYAKLATDKNLQQQQTLALSRALKLIGSCMRLNALLHERQSSILWQKMSDLYQIASNHDLLDLQITDNINAFKKHTTITSIIKRNLLFSICNPYSYSSQQVDQIFEVMDQYCDLLKINLVYNVKPTRADFYWDYSAQSVAHYYQPLPNTLSIVYLNTTELVKFFQSTKFNYPFAEFNKIICCLSGYQEVIHSIVYAEPIICNLTSGFDQITEFLYEQKQKGKSLNIDANHTNLQFSSLDNIKLEPLEMASRSIHSSANTIWKGGQSISTIQTTKIQHAKDQNYCIAEINILNCKINEPVLFIAGEIKASLGIIRQIQNPKLLNGYRILAEKQEGQISCEKILDKPVEETAILITKPGPSFEVFLPPGKYTTGSDIELENGKYILDSLIEENTYFLHFHLRTCSRSS